MKVFEKIGRVLDDVMGVDGNDAGPDIASCVGFSLFIVAFIALMWALSPMVAALIVAAPFAGLALFCILSFFKALSGAVRKHFFEK